MEKVYIVVGSSAWLETSRCIGAFASEAEAEAFEDRCTRATRAQAAAATRYYRLLQRDPLNHAVLAEAQQARRALAAEHPAGEMAANDTDTTFRVESCPMSVGEVHGPVAPTSKLGAA